MRGVSKMMVNTKPTTKEAVITAPHNSKIERVFRSISSRLVPRAIHKIQACVRYTEYVIRESGLNADQERMRPTKVPLFVMHSHTTKVKTNGQMVRLRGNKMADQIGS